MRMTPAFRAIAILLAVILAGIAIFTYITSNQTERAYIFVSDLDQYEFIENTEMLQSITIPKTRDFVAVTDPALIVGRYTSQNVTEGQLVQPGLLLDELPDGRRQFENGLLPLDVNGYPIGIPSDVAAVFKPDDLVDILVVINQDGIPGEDDVIFPLFQKVRALEVIGDGENVSSTLVVGLNYQQIGVYEGLKEMEGVSFTAAINQVANADYPALYPSQLYPDLNQPEIRELFAAPTPTPLPQPEEAAAENTAEEGR